jgi:hypothetical protein
MMTPNYKELALEGKFLLLDVKQAEAAEHNRRSAHVVAARPSPTAPAATLASFNVFDRDGHVIGQVKSNGGRYVAHDAADQTLGSFRDARAALAAVEQGAIDASWREAIKSVDAEQSTRSNYGAGATSADDHGWGEIIAKIEREQPAQRSAGRRQEDDANFGWTETIRAMNAKVGACA